MQCLDEDVTQAFRALISRPTSQSIQEWLVPLEQVVCLLYDCTSHQKCINELSTKAAVDSERQSNRWCTPSTGCTNPAHREGCLPSWSQLGPDDDFSSKASTSKWRRRRLREAGKYDGQPYEKPHKLVGNLYVTLARRAAEDTASVGRFVCSALLFALQWTLHRLTNIANVTV